MSNITYLCECMQCKWKSAYDHAEWEEEFGDDDPITWHYIYCPVCGHDAMQVDRIVEGSESDGTEEKEPPPVKESETTWYCPGCNWTADPKVDKNQEKCPFCGWTLCEVNCEFGAKRVERIVEDSDSVGAGKEIAMEARVTRITIAPKGETVDSSQATHVEIADEGGGEFVTISQPFTDRGVRIDTGEWECIRVAVDDAIARCRTSKDKSDA